MIRLRMSVTDFERMRFAYSPLTEVAESLYMLHSGDIHPLHRGWFEKAREDLRRVDTDVLRAIVPTHGYVARFLLGGTVDAGTSIEQQLHLLAGCPPEQLHADLQRVWRGDELPPAALQLVAAGASAGQLIADALWQYWQAAIGPYWGRIRALLDADVAYRASQLARGGIEALLSDLHPELELVDHEIQIVRRASSAEHDLIGAGLLLVPCAFAWPHLIASLSSAGPPSLTYGPRGIGTLWQAAGQELPEDDDALGALLGRTRAAILSQVALPMSTTDLARELGQSPPAVSAHLSILRRCGLVTSWRSGRRVLYQRTPLATSVVVASTPTASIAPDSPAQAG
jgi:biotin operon repressor